MIQPLAKEKCLPELIDIFQELVAHRHDIHAHPECGFDTQRTVGKLKAFLAKHGIPEAEMDDKTSPGSLFVAIEGNRPGKTVAIRADIDALKMIDKTTNEWRSTVEGRAHACGHDGHQTWLLGVGAYLAAHRDFPGRVVLLFQAAEETGKGAQKVVNDGFIEKYNVAEMYAGHDEPFLSKGQVGFKVGYLQAASDSFSVKFTGVGTHGGRPHMGVDPIPALTELYQALQTLISRKVNPLESAVLSVCFMAAGNVETYNVVPAEASLGGTVRTFLPEIRDMIETNSKRMAEGIAMAHGLKCEFHYERLISSVNNDEKITKVATHLAQELLGKENVVVEMTPFMSSEDFSVYQEKVPAAICRIGIKDENHTVSVHNPAFDFNDEVLPLAATLFINLAKTRLKELSGE